MTSFRTRACLVAAILLHTPALTAQSVAYTTFGPTDQYNSGVGYTISTSQWIASGFTFGGATGDVLSGLRIAGVSYSDQDHMNASIWQGVDMSSATLLESWTGLPTGPAPGSIVALSSTLNPTLTNGSSYWVMVSSASQLYSAWNWSSASSTGPMQLSYNTGDTWEEGFGTRPAFEVSTMPDVTGDVVPEPATMTLLATGLLGLGAARRKKRQQR